MLLLLVVHETAYVWASTCQPVDLSTCPWSLSDPFCISHEFSSPCRLLHHNTLLLPKSHHVLLLGLVHNTYVDHDILIDARVFVENDVQKIIRIVAPKCIDRFSPMKPFSLCS